MAPTFESGTPRSRLPSLSDLIDSLFKHPGLLFGASTVILGIVAAKRIMQSTRHPHEQGDPLLAGSTPTDEKHDYNHSSISDPPPPLQSVLTSADLFERPSPSQQQQIASDPLPCQRQHFPGDPALRSTSPSNPGRRHSFPSPTETETDSPPTTKIMSDHTSYFPIVDASGVRQPGRWRRRTLVFEMLPTPDQSHNVNLGAAEVVQEALHVTDMEWEGDEADVGPCWKHEEGTQWSVWSKYSQ